jgi:6-phosphogluconolactonase
MNTTFFVGSYTQMIVPGFGGSGTGIASVILNELTGELNVETEVETKNPGYITLSDDKKYLYALTESFKEDKPTVKSYRILSDKSLKFINEQVIPGELACHIHYHKEAIFIVCYGTGSVLMYPVEKESGSLLPLGNEVIHKGNSIHETRQESPHPHQICFLQCDNIFLVPDLGLDSIKAYKQTNNGFESFVDFDIKISAGNGPRHLVLSKNNIFAYVINELTGNITVLKKEGDRYKFISEISSLPKGFVGNGASAIRLHPNNEFLYVANRGSETISIFKVEDETLRYVGIESTKGKTLREFNISPSGNWLIACLQDSNELISYKVQNNGTLIEKNRNTSVISPVCLIF